MNICSLWLTDAVSRNLQHLKTKLSLSLRLAFPVDSDRGDGRQRTPAAVRVRPGPGAATVRVGVRHAAAAAATAADHGLQRVGGHGSPEVGRGVAAATTHHRVQLQGDLVTVPRHEEATASPRSLWSLAVSSAFERCLTWLPQQPLIPKSLRSLSPIIGWSRIYRGLEAKVCKHEAYVYEGGRDYVTSQAYDLSSTWLLHGA